MTKINQPITSRRVAVHIYSPVDVGSDPVVWLTDQATADMVLLAHADDGVIWGKGKSGGIEVAPDTLFNANFEKTELRAMTLQQARLFDANQEIFLWRVDEGTWRARTITDGGADEEERQTIDETQVLWGTRVEASAGGFCRVADGVEGLHHTPPLTKEALQAWGSEQDGQRPLRLQIRHYLEEDKETGWQQIGLSRLVDIVVDIGEE